MGTSEPVILKHQDGTEEICRINGGLELRRLNALLSLSGRTRVTGS